MESHQLVDKIVDRIHALGARKLSYGGRLTLIKAVLNTLHSYWARIFIIPTRTIKDINAACRNYLWQGHEHYTTAPSIAWDTICQDKTRGGLGIPSTQEWNIATLGKYVWWIAQKKDSLWVKWVHAIYIKGKDWMDYTPSTNSSWVWRKICIVKDKLKMGFNGTWWQTPGNQYRTKEGYEWLRPHGNEVEWKDFVWNRVSIPKHAFITWMAAQNRLRTKDRMGYMNLQDENCFLCTSSKESHQHLFFKCTFSSAVLQGIARWMKMTIPDTNTIMWWQHKKMKHLLHKKYVAAALASLIYHIWMVRNNYRIHQTMPPPTQIVLKVKGDIQTILRLDDRARARKQQNWASRLLE